MTIGELLKKYNAPEAELLLAETLKQPKEFLYLHPETKLNIATKTKFLKMYSKFSSGFPIAYILGYKYFYGLKFKVSRDVLIPRPESEWLIDEAVRYINLRRQNSSKAKSTKLRILDMGTGSGCLITSLAVTTRSSGIVATKTTRASVLPKIEFIASDISGKALAVAKKNATTYKASIKFVESNLFENITGKFDLIIANLPYVPVSDYIKLLPNLKAEPKHALTDGTENSILIQKLLLNLPQHLSRNGVALLEIDPTSKAVITKLNKEKKLGLKITYKQDHNSLIRFAIIKNSH